MSDKVAALKKEWSQAPKDKEAVIRLRADDVLTPIFDLEMGKRMSLIRMKMLMDQSQLGRLLGVSQQTISKLESGRINVPRRPFNLSRFNAVFGDSASYILKASGTDRYNPSQIVRKYWDTKLEKSGSHASRADKKAAAKAAAKKEGDNV